MREMSRLEWTYKWTYKSVQTGRVYTDGIRKHSERTGQTQRIARSGTLFYGQKNCGPSRRTHHLASCHSHWPLTIDLSTHFLPPLWTMFGLCLDRHVRLLILQLRLRYGVQSTGPQWQHNRSDTLGGYLKLRQPSERDYIEH